jgi:predicted nuclease of predicted toxin-antitoxin system
VHFLVDASLPRGTGPHIQSLGHNATDVRDIGLGGAPDADVARHAQAQGLCLISRDFDFADIRNYPPDQFAGLVVIDLPNTALVPAILGQVGALLGRTDVLTVLPGRLAIVEPGRIRLRPAP